jgi:hypothetical protein
MYLWAVSIDGDQTVKGVDVDLDVPFSDIFDNLNGALSPAGILYAKFRIAVDGGKNLKPAFLSFRP